MSLSRDDREHESWHLPLAELLELDAEWRRSTGSLPVTALRLSVRLANCLAKKRLETLADIAAWTPAELMEIRNFGLGALREVLRLLALTDVWERRLFTQRQLRLESLRGLFARPDGRLHTATGGRRKGGAPPGGEAAPTRPPRPRRAGARGLGKAGTAEGRVAAAPPLTLGGEWELFGGDAVYARWLGVGVLSPSLEAWAALEAAGLEGLQELLRLTVQEARERLGDDAAAELQDRIPEAAACTRELAGRRRSRRIAGTFLIASDPPLSCLGLAGPALRKLEALGLFTCGALLRAVRCGEPLLFLNLGMAGEVWTLLGALGICSGSARSAHRSQAAAAGLTLDAVLAAVTAPGLEREREVLLLRSALTPGTVPWTLDQIAQSWGRSRDGVRSVEQRALRRVFAAGSAAETLQQSLVRVLGEFSGMARIEELAAELCVWVPPGELDPPALVRFLLNHSALVTRLHPHSAFAAAGTETAFGEVAAAARRLWQESPEDLAGEALTRALMRELRFTGSADPAFVHRSLAVLGVTAEDRSALGSRPLQLCILDALRAAQRPLTLGELSRRVGTGRKGAEDGDRAIAVRASAYPEFIQVTPRGDYWLAGAPPPAQAGAPADASRPVPAGAASTTEPRAQRR